jgi:hypothetical protein
LKAVRGYLLDTNIAIAILANEPIVMEFVKQAANDKMPLFFSVITECEVFSGMPSEQKLHGLRLFNKRRCINVTSTIARIAGDLRRVQRDKGRKLKTPDALIIATAIDAQLGLVSRDADMQFIKNEGNVLVVRL